MTFNSTTVNRQINPIDPPQKITEKASTTVLPDAVRYCNKKLARSSPDIILNSQIFTDSGLIISRDIMQNIYNFLKGTTPQHKENMKNFSKVGKSFRDVALENILDCKIPSTQLDKALVRPFPNLRKIEIDSSVTVDQIKNLCQFEALEEIEISSKAEIFDAHLEILGKFSKLKVLIFQNNFITNIGLNHLMSLENLTHLIFEASFFFTDAGVEKITQLKNLQYLSLPFSKITNAGFEKIAELENLEHLNVSCTTINNLGLAGLTKKLKKLKHLDLTGCNFLNKACWADLSWLENLAHLNLSRSYSDGFSELRLFKEPKLKNLEYLNLSQLQISETDLIDIAQCKKLKCLILAHCVNSGSPKFEILTSLKNLEELNLSKLNISDRQPIRLSKFTKLKHLNLSECIELTDSCLEGLSELTELKTLNLSKCGKLTDSFLRNLAFLKKIEELDLSNLKISGSNFTHLRNLTELKILNLNHCIELGKPVFRYLGQLKSMERLHLERCKINDSDVTNFFSELENLEFLTFRGCNTTNALEKILSKFNRKKPLHVTNHQGYPWIIPANMKS